MNTMILQYLCYTIDRGNITSLMAKYLHKSAAGMSVDTGQSDISLYNLRIYHAY